MIILPAQPSDAALLTQITRASKAYWPYSEALLESWEDELTISEAHIQESTVNIARIDEIAVGYYSLLPPADSRIKLENLFVLPEYIGKGIGTALLQHALLICAELKCPEVWLEADPHAEDFYLQHGFKTIGYKSSTVPDRFLPVMCRNVP